MDLRASCHELLRQAISPKQLIQHRRLDPVIPLPAFSRAARALADAVVKNG
jgi:hypothetical protein